MADYVIWERRFYMERQDINTGDKYRHFRGNLYQILTIGKHADTLEEYVVYQALYGEFQVFIRSLQDFFCVLDKGKYPDAQQKHRFEKVEIKKLSSEEAPKERKEEVEPVAESDNKDDPDTERMIEQSDNKEGMRKFMEFLDAETYKEKLEIFTKMQDKLDERILTNIAVSLDLVVDEKNPDESCQIIIRNLEQRCRFESFRLR